jgi:D-alanyl-lipoteichoic acid acyltransferase DltB (MBOAT superfamily)
MFRKKLKQKKTPNSLIQQVAIKNRIISPFQISFLQFAQAKVLFQDSDCAKNHLQAKAFSTSLNM